MFRFNIYTAEGSIHEKDKAISFYSSWKPVKRVGLSSFRPFKFVSSVISSMVDILLLNQVSG